jgi:hypothetical protein
MFMLDADHGAEHDAFKLHSEKRPQDTGMGWGHESGAINVKLLAPLGLISATTT